MLFLKHVDTDEILYLNNESKQKFIVGRVETSDLCLQDDRSISRKHCVFTIKNNLWHIYDDTSKYGTTLNDVKVTKDPVSLKEGDKIEFGTLDKNIWYVHKKKNEIRQSTSSKSKLVGNENNSAASNIFKKISKADPGPTTSLEQNSIIIDDSDEESGISRKKNEDFCGNRGRVLVSDSDGESESSVQANFVSSSIPSKQSNVEHIFDNKASSVQCSFSINFDNSDQILSDKIIKTQQQKTIRNKIFLSDSEDDEIQPKQNAANQGFLKKTSFKRKNNEKSSTLNASKKIKLVDNQQQPTTSKEIKVVDNQQQPTTSKQNNPLSHFIFDSDDEDLQKCSSSKIKSCMKNFFEDSDDEEKEKPRNSLFSRKRREMDDVFDFSIPAEFQPKRFKPLKKYQNNSEDERKILETKSHLIAQDNTTSQNSSKSGFSFLYKDIYSDVEDSDTWISSKMGSIKVDESQNEFDKFSKKSIFGVAKVSVDPNSTVQKLQRKSFIKNQQFNAKVPIITYRNLSIKDANLKFG